MGFFDRLKKGLTKTRENFTHNIERLIIGYADIDDELIDDLEETLLMSDVGVKTTETLIAAVRKGIKKKEICTPEDLIPFLEKEIVRILETGENTFHMAEQGPTVLLVVGTNGVGKTTTIGKLSAYYRRQGKSVLLAAADTFRAAAIDQLEIWGKRADAQVIKHGEGSDVRFRGHRMKRCSFLMPVQGRMQSARRSSLRRQRPYRGLSLQNWTERQRAA